MRCAPILRAGIGLVLGVVPALGPGRAHAEQPYEGTWTAGPMRVRVTVDSWGSDCGPRPPAKSSEPGGTVRIEQAGSELRLAGAVSWRTDRCFTPNRAARRMSASAGDGRWEVTCRTPEDDPKAERGVYVLRAAGEDRLVFRERSQYDWQLKQSRCVATRTAERTLTRAGAGGGADPSPAGADESGTDATRECDPGQPARIALTPRRRAIEPGQRVCFFARVLDAKGCPVPDATVRYELQRPPSVGGEMREGCFEAGTTAAEAEGTFRVVARAAGLRRQATVVVRSADLSDLIARGAIAEGGSRPGNGPQAEREEASRVAARAGGDGDGLLWPLLSAGLALLVLVGLAWFLVGRRRGATGRGTAGTPSEDVAESMPAASARPPGPALRCPVCHLDYPPGTLFCPADGARLDEPPPEPEPPARQAMICPACRRGYAPQARFCPHDSEELVPYAAFVDRQREQEAQNVQQGRICPTCGARYDGSVAFCGKDGSELVLVN